MKKQNSVRKPARYRRRKAGSKKPAAAPLLSFIQANPERMLELLHKHGVTFCAGCYLTFSGPLERVAAYHAVPHPERFLADVQKAVGSRRPRKRHGA